MVIDRIKRGRIWKDIPGKTPADVLSNFIQSIHLPDSFSRDDLLVAVLEREALMSTACGHGIALPHPRNPFAADPEEELISIGFLCEPVDWNALDSLPVSTVILIVSSSSRRHLGVLSRINFFCQDEIFQNLLRQQSSEAEIINFIQMVEKTWH
ncbi:hypothetical protein FACS1894172_06370 [Spirochaetia bacterium]|nr:hypothetical protein FACS1894172_06370 [Spirochaetia bacterium]